jgi:hypothetical protein
MSNLRMKTLSLALGLLVVGGAHAQSFSPLSAQDLALQLGVIALYARDEQQTEQIARNPARWVEENRILGTHPSVGAVRGYFAGVAVGSTALLWALPPSARPYAQGAQIGVEIIVTQHNRGIGLHGSF